MNRPTRKTQVIEGVAPAALPSGELLPAGQPASLKGVARDWRPGDWGRGRARHHKEAQ